MLQAIKGSIASPWLRYSLFGILIASFGVWGIGDVLRRLVTPYSELLAEGKGIQIDRRSFATHWQRSTAVFRAQGLTSQQLLTGALPRLVLDRMLSQALLQRAAKDLGLQVPSSVLQKTIAQEPLFADEDGRFASWRFLSFLRRANLNERIYLQELQASLVQSSLLDSLAFELSLPEKFLRELLAAEQEQREIDILRLPLLPLASFPDPGDETLKTFMQKEEALFRLPEYRRFAYAILAFAPEAALDEALVRSYYEQRKEELREEEKRSFRQLFFVEESAAREAEAELGRGRSLEEIAGKFSAPSLLAEKQTRVDLLDVAVADAVFGMAQRGEVVLAKGGLGWYLLRLEDIVLSSVPNFEALRPALTQRLLQERAAERYVEAVATAEDMLLAGATLEETAETLGMTLATTPLLDAGKFLTDGTAIGKLWQKLSEEEEQQLLETGFALSAAGEVSQAFESEGTTGQTEALFLELREVQESQLADLTQKRQEILAVYRDLRRQEKQQEHTKSLVEAAQKAGLRKVARKEGQTVRRNLVMRNAQEWDADFLSSLFLAQKGDVLIARGVIGDIVVQLAEVRRPAVSLFAPAQVEEFAKTLATTLPLSVYRQTLERQASLRVDEEAFAEFVSTGLSP